MARKKAKAAGEGEAAPAVVPAPAEPDWTAEDAARNSAGSYAAAIDAIRMEGVRAGRFLPRPGNAAEIKASPVVEDCVRVGPCTLYRGDSTAIMPLLAEGGVPWLDACVTDPPYELGFMGKGWDSSGVAADWRTWGGARIALKPGAHLVAFAGSRTYHRITAAIDDAGFEVRDQLMWIYGSGFPKSLDISKAIDKAAGVADQRGYVETTGGLAGGTGNTVGKFTGRQLSSVAVTAAAAAWNGWGTALKPWHEPVCFARKPLAEGTVAANVLAWATGAINVDAARVGSETRVNPPGGTAPRLEMGGGWRADAPDTTAEGRWPANVLTDGSLEVLEAFPPSARDAIRFFYAAKADKAEREFGLAGMEQLSGGRLTERQDGSAGLNSPRAGAGRNGGRSNIHPTVKPVDLMRWLCRLVTPPGGTVLDPFMGSGTTGIAAVREGFGFIGIEQDADYFQIAHARIAAAVRQVENEPTIVEEITRATKRIKGGGQGDLF